MVRHKILGQEGRIISLDKCNSKALIMAGNVKLSANIQDLIFVSDTKRPEPSESVKSVPSQVPVDYTREINLIGYKVEDALPLIDKMIDRSMVEGELSLRIIHGYGTGILKAAIREHLNNFSCVKRVSGADPRSGGDAITIVELN